MSIIVPSNMPTGESPFDRIRQVRPDGSEFWSARDLQSLMGYSTWQHLAPAIKRAMQAGSNTGMDLTSHFTGSRKVVPRPQGGGTAYEDYELSREAAYLVAMNGNPIKTEVAAAQAYFAARTVQAEALVPRTFAEALELAARQARALEITGPKAEKFDQWQAAPDSVYVVEWAKKFGLTQQEGYEALRAMNIIFKQPTTDGSGMRIQAPKRGYEDCFETVQEWLPGPRKWVPVLKVTPHGQVLLGEMLVENGWAAK